MIHVFVVGSKGIPAKYGGFETFVENLTGKKESKNIYYHVSCMNNDEKHFEYNNADCFNVKVPFGGAPGRILHVSRVLFKVEKWKKNNENVKTIVYILGCRIGPLLIPHAWKMRKMGIKILVNPDGLEWKRDKWNRLAKRFLKYCEKCLVENADLVICDSKNIEKYILDTYPQMNGKTTYIAYGADVTRSNCSDENMNNWLGSHGLKKDNYYLIVGRFVPENNFETMILEYMKSNTEKPLVIITNAEHNKFYQQLKERTGFTKDSRIKFVGTVYDAELLKKIRECAFAYMHGHEVGGTNPSLLEALASTKLNLLLDVGFNREVAADGAVYWKKDNLTEMIDVMDKVDKDYCEMMHKTSMNRVIDLYSWERICRSYEKIFVQ